MDDVQRLLCRGRIKGGRLPHQLHIWSLKEAFAGLRDRARADGVEWGSCIELRADGLVLPDPVPGVPDGVDPRCPPPVHTVYVGFAHVHLPDPETGKPYFGFSDRDYRGTLNDGDSLALLTNGPEVFALVRTADYTLPPQAVSDAEFRRWERLYEDALATTGAALDRALAGVNFEICRRLGLAFYSGAWGEPLERVYQPLAAGRI